MPKIPEKLDLVALRELMLANSIQLDALTQLLIEEGVFSEERFLKKLRQVQTDYHRREGNA